MVSKTEGWIEILPGACAIALADMPMMRKPMSMPNQMKPMPVRGWFLTREGFCVATENRQFSIEGRRDCRRRGLIEADFAVVAGSSDGAWSSLQKKEIMAAAAPAWRVCSAF